MRHTLLFLPLLTLSLVACGDSDTADGAPGGEGGEANNAATPATVELLPFGGAPVQGSASLQAKGEETEVVLRVQGGTPGQLVEAHVHEGSCEQQGNVVYPLAAINLSANGEGTSTSTVAAPIASLSAKKHYLQVHTPGQNPGPPTACGNIVPAAAE